LNFFPEDESPLRINLELDGLGTILNEMNNDIGDEIGRLLIVEDLTKDMIELL
jgi:hypothetical protein